MKSALLVLDLINDIVHPDGKIAASAKYVKDTQVIKHVNDTIAFARKNNFLIIFVKVGFNSGYPECPEHSPLFGRAKQIGALQLNSWGTEFHSELQILLTDLIVTKHRVSAFYATPLEALLGANQIHHLYIVGVSTDMAVQSTAREAHDRDYQVTIVADACGTSSKEIHENALGLLQRIATITTNDRL